MFALLTSALTSVLLGLGLWKLDSLTQHVESAATLLLFVPGLLTLFVIRPGEHQFATTAYSGVRVLLLGVAVCTLCGGWLVTIDLDPVLRMVVWQCLLAYTSLTTLILLIGRASMYFAVRGPATANEIRPPPRPPRFPCQMRGVGAAAVLAALLALALLPLIIAGRDRLSIGGRLSAAIEQAAAGNRRLSLRSFAEIPWTRLYVFEPGTVRARIADMIGENSVATAADRHVMVPYPSVQTATTLLVFVAGKDIVRTIVLRDSSADLTGASYPRQCYLRPTDVLKVLTTSPPRLMIRTRSRCRRSPLPTTGAVG